MKTPKQTVNWSEAKAIADAGVKAGLIPAPVTHAPEVRQKVMAMKYVVMENALGYPRILAGFTGDGLAVWKKDITRIRPFANKTAANWARQRAGEGDLVKVTISKYGGPGEWHLVEAP